MAPQTVRGAAARRRTHASRPGSGDAGARYSARRAVLSRARRQKPAPPRPPSIHPRNRDHRLNEAFDTCRADVWLWRARFFKTRTLAARTIAEGGVRLARGAARTPLDKPSRSLRPGDVLSFAQGPRWLAVKVEAVGERRGPAPEARTLYSVMEGSRGAG